MYRILYYMAGKGTFTLHVHALVYPSKAETMRGAFSMDRMAVYSNPYDSITLYMIATISLTITSMYSVHTAHITMQLLLASTFGVDSFRAHRASGCYC